MMIGEVSLWWCFYLIATASEAFQTPSYSDSIIGATYIVPLLSLLPTTLLPFINWSIIGAILLTLLFQGDRILEHILFP
jgi:hypothetical protein